MPSHGFVAIDRQEAVDRRLPVSMYLPSDETKGVYLLEAYHQLHCLVCVDSIEIKRRDAEIPAEIDSLEFLGSCFK